MATIQKDYKKKVVSLQNEMRNMLLPINACSDEKTKMKLYANFDLDSFEKKLNELKDVFKLVKSTSQEKIYFNDFISKTELVIYSIKKQKQIILEAAQKVFGLPLSSITFVN